MIRGYVHSIPGATPGHASCLSPFSPCPPHQRVGQTNCSSPRADLVSIEFQVLSPVWRNNRPPGPRALYIISSKEKACPGWKRGPVHLSQLLSLSGARYTARRNDASSKTICTPI